MAKKYRYNKLLTQDEILTNKNSNFFVYGFIPQNKHFSYDVQLEEIIKYCDKHNFHLTKVFNDLNTIKDYINIGDKVITYSLLKLSNNSRKFDVFYTVLEKNKGNLMIIDDENDYMTTHGKMTLLSFIISAEYRLNKKRDRIMKLRGSSKRYYITTEELNKQRSLLRKTN
jgi:hypothetical protein